MKNIAVLCRNGKLRHMLECELKSAGYSVFGAFADFGEFCDAVGNESVDAVISDVEQDVSVPVLSLSDYCGRSSECVSVDRLLDSLSTVFASGISASDNLTLRYDRASKTVSYGGSTVCLSRTENELFDFLYRNSGSYLDVDRIIENVWHGEGNRTLAAYYIHSLRKKTEDSFGIKIIRTGRGKGYGIFI